MSLFRCIISAGMMAISMGVASQGDPLPAAINIADLGQLSLNFTQVSQVDQFALPKVSAQVSYLPGTEYALTLPFAPFSQQPLVPAQSTVTQGQPIFRLAGSEIVHFFESLEAREAIFALAEQRYQQNLPLFKSRAINQSTWQQILSQFYESRMELGHLHHASDWLTPQAQEGLADMLAPISGIFMPTPARQEMESTVLGYIVPADQLRLRLQVPATVGERVEQLVADSCRVSVERRQLSASGLSMTLWSAPIVAVDGCNMRYAQRVEVTPMLQMSVQHVPKPSVLAIGSQHYVLKQSSQQLQPIEVDIIGDSQDELVIRAQEQLLNGEILVSSVSAVQGVLLGFGGE